MARLVVICLPRSIITKLDRKMNKTFLLKRGALLLIVAMTIVSCSTNDPETTFSIMESEVRTGQWAKVYDHLEPQSQGELQLILSEAAYLDTNDELQRDSLRNLKGRELFLKMVKQYSGLASLFDFPNYTIVRKSVSVDTAVFSLNYQSASLWKQKEITFVKDNEQWKYSPDISVNFSLESPQESYRKIILASEEGRWNYVYDRIDKRSQGQLEVSLKILTGLASAFERAFSDHSNTSSRTLNALDTLSGRDLFLAMGQQSKDLLGLKGNFEYSVDQCTIEDGVARLKVSVTNGDEQSTQTVTLIKEDWLWKLSLK